MIKDYDLIIDYLSEKANVVTNALNREFSVTLAHLRTAFVPLLLNMKIMGISLDYDENEVTWLLYRFVIFVKCFVVFHHKSGTILAWRSGDL